MSDGFGLSSILEAAFSMIGDAIAEPPGGGLYHYTTYEGLEGILRTSALWATEVAYLNDGTEQTYARSIIEDHLNNLGSKYGEVVNAFIAEAREYLQWLVQDSRRFVTCFCAEDDLLSMWRGYGQGGFSLGFDTSIRHPSIQMWPPFFGINSFAPVRYGDDIRELPIFSILDSICHRAAESPDKPREGLGEVLANFMDMALVGAKHHSFREEKEWRAVHTNYFEPVLPGVLKFRRGNVDVKPYLEFVIFGGLDDEGRPKPHEKLPLKTVRMGPTFRPQETKRALEWLLQKYDYTDVQVLESSTPLRG